MSRNLRLTAFKNPEKTNHTDARMGGILPSFPARHGLFGRPGVGKGSVCQNLLGRGDFDTFTVVHWDKNAPEWVELLDDQPHFKMMGFREDGFPQAEEFDIKKRNALVLDEIPWDCLSTAQKSHAERIFNYFASHRSISVYVLAQDLFSVPISIRRSLDYICLWPSPVKLTESLYTRMLKIDLGDLFKRFTKKKYDFICIDTTGQGPRVRLNFFQPIEGVVEK